MVLSLVIDFYGYEGDHGGVVRQADEVGVGHVVDDQDDLADDRGNRQLQHSRYNRIMLKYLYQRGMISHGNHFSSIFIMTAFRFAPGHARHALYFTVC